MLLKYADISGGPFFIFNMRSRNLYLGNNKICLSARCAEKSRRTITKVGRESIGISTVAVEAAIGGRSALYGNSPKCLEGAGGDASDEFPGNLKGGATVWYVADIGDSQMSFLVERNNEPATTKDSF